MKQSIVWLVVVGVAFVSAQKSPPTSEADCGPHQRFIECAYTTCGPDDGCEGIPPGAECFPICGCVAGFYNRGDGTCLPIDIGPRKLFNIFILSSIESLIFLFIIFKFQECGPNQWITGCKSNCPLECGKEPVTCPIECQSAGCECMPGYYKKGDDCVLSDECRCLSEFARMAFYCIIYSFVVRFRLIGVIKMELNSQAYILSV